VFASRYPFISGAIGLTINLLIPEEVDHALLASGIPGYQGLSGIRQGEVRFLRAIKNSTVSRFLGAKATGLLSQVAGNAFGSFCKEAVFKGYKEEEVRIGRFVLDVIWRGRMIEFKTARVLYEDDKAQLKAFATYAKDEGLDLLYFFLRKPTKGTYDTIKKTGGNVMYIFE
jgi:hypothetical protein